MNGTSVACGVFLVLGMFVAGLMTPTRAAEEPAATDGPVLLKVRSTLGTSDPNGVLKETLSQPTLMLSAGGSGSVRIESIEDGARVGLETTILPTTPTAEGVTVRVDVSQIAGEATGGASTSRATEVLSRTLDVAWDKPTILGPVKIASYDDPVVIHLTIERVASPTPSP